jgi:hypothetical protein
VGPVATAFTPEGSVRAGTEPGLAKDESQALFRSATKQPPASQRAHCCSRRGGATLGLARDGRRRPAFVVVRASRRRLHGPCLAQQAGPSATKGAGAKSPVALVARRRSLAPRAKPPASLRSGYSARRRDTIEIVPKEHCRRAQISGAESVAFSPLRHPLRWRSSGPTWRSCGLGVTATEHRQGHTVPGPIPPPEKNRNQTAMATTATITTATATSSETLSPELILRLRGMLSSTLRSQGYNERWAERRIVSPPKLPGSPAPNPDLGRCRHDRISGTTIDIRDRGARSDSHGSS